MAAYVESLTDTFDYSKDWKETIGDQGTSSTHLTNDAQENTRVGLIPFNKKRSAARFFLGFAYSDTSSPWRLHRENPHPDPEFPWLYACDISFAPVGPKANEDIDPVYPKKESPFYPDSFYANYEKLVATVRYRSFRCLFRSDDDIDTNQDEWIRNVYIDAAPRVEALSADGVGQMQFAEGPANDPNGTQFPAPIAAIKAQTGYVLNWLSVPYSYISSNPNFFYPKKLLACVGTVNSAKFLGMDEFDVGTLFMGPPSFAIKPFPVASASTGDPLLAVDVSIPFDYFDPPKGVPAPGSTYRGHRLLPYRKNGLWYYATRIGDGSKEILPLTDFNTVFQNAHQP